MGMPLSESIQNRSSAVSLRGLLFLKLLPQVPVSLPEEARLRCCLQGRRSRSNSSTDRISQDCACHSIVRGAPAETTLSPKQMACSQTSTVSKETLFINLELLLLLLLKRLPTESAETRMPVGAAVELVELLIDCDSATEVASVITVLSMLIFRFESVIVNFVCCVDPLIIQ